MTHTAGEEDQQQGERIPVGGENPAETADAGGDWIMSSKFVGK